jgi:hypothetical protein
MAVGIRVFFRASPPTNPARILTAPIAGGVNNWGRWYCIMQSEGISPIKLGECVGIDADNPPRPIWRC